MSLRFIIYIEGFVKAIVKYRPKFMKEFEEIVEFELELLSLYLSTQMNYRYFLCWCRLLASSGMDNILSAYSVTVVVFYC